MEIAIFTFGVILFLLGLIGKVEAKELKVGTDNRVARAIVGLVGASFILMALNRGDYISLPSWSESPRWEGTWSTSWGEKLDFSSPNLIKVPLYRDGDRIEGSYKYFSLQAKAEISGTLSGSPKGQSLVGQFEEFGHGKEWRGTFEFMMFADGREFVGKYRRNHELENVRVWKGSRVGDPSPVNVVAVQDYGGINLRDRPLSSVELRKIVARKQQNSSFTHSSFIGFVENGTRVEVLEDIGEWYRISVILDGVVHEGFVPKSFNEKPVLVGLRVSS